MRIEKRYKQVKFQYKSHDKLYRELREVCSKLSWAQSRDKTKYLTGRNAVGPAPIKKLSKEADSLL